MVEPVTLSQREYVKLQDRLSGRVWVERGPGLVFQEPHVTLMGAKAAAFSLEAHQYIRLQVGRAGRVCVYVCVCVRTRAGGVRCMCGGVLLAPC